MKPNYIPNENRVVVKELAPKKKEETVTTSGIILTETQEEEKLVEVEVVAVGDGHNENGTTTVMYLVPGKKVVIGRRTGVPYDMDGVSYRVIRQADVQFLISDQ